jgi:hypothetical protein
VFLIVCIQLQKIIASEDIEKNAVVINDPVRSLKIDDNKNGTNKDASTNPTINNKESKRSPLFFCFLLLLIFLRVLRLFLNMPARVIFFCLKAIVKNYVWILLMRKYNAVSIG